MIQDFFKSSDSPLSNNQVSLNFTRTSRQYQSNSKKLQSQQQILPNQIDYFTLIQQQNQQIQQWIENVKNDSIKLNHYDDQIVDWIRIHQKCQGWSGMTQEIFRKIRILGKRVQGNGWGCFKCQGFQRNLHKLEIQLALKQTQLLQNAKAIQNFKNIKFHLQQKNQKLQNEHKSFEPLNRKLHQKSLQFSKIIEQKDRQMNRLNQQLERLQILQKSCLLQKSSSYNFKPRNSMQRSKSFLLSAAKNSTSHSQFNISNPITKSSNIPQQIIQLPNNQISQKFSQFLLTLQKLKQIFLQLYKKEQKQYLRKFLGKDFLKNNKNSQQMKELIAGFRKGNKVYQVARGSKVLLQYIKRDKQNFFVLIKAKDYYTNINSMVNDFKHQSQKQINFIQQNQKKKQSKLQSGLQSEIKNLNSQLQSLRKNLTRQKQQKKLLKQKLQSNKKTPKSSQQFLLQQSYHHLVLSHKELQYNFQKQHKQRMKLHSQLEKYQQQQRKLSHIQNKQSQPQIKVLCQIQNNKILQQKQIQTTLFNVKKPILHRNSHSNTISPQPIDKQSLKRLRISSRSSLS